MIPALPLFHRIAGRAVIVLGTGEAAAAKRRLVERAGGVPVDEDAGAEVPLAFVALDDPLAAEAAVARLRGRGLLVNCVDRPELCDFTSPSLIDRAPVVIAIGTDGASAGLAKALRLRLEGVLPQRLGALAAALGAARAGLRQRFADAGERRRALDAALGEGGALDPLRDGPEAAARVADWLAGTVGARTWPSMGGIGGIVEIHLRSADPEDLTLREARLLGSADGIAHEPGVPQAVLDRARADAARRRIVNGAAFPASDLAGMADETGLWLVIRAGY